MDNIWNCSFISRNCSQLFEWETKAAIISRWMGIISHILWAFYNWITHLGSITVVFLSQKQQTPADPSGWGQRLRDMEETMSAREVEFEDEILQEASDYLEYHINMYISTLLKLLKHAEEGKPGTIETNAMLVAHLIHFRLIYDFLSKSESHHDNDVLAVDFFYDKPGAYEPLEDNYLKEWREKVNTRTAHLTIEPITTEQVPLLISRQEWEIGHIAHKLVPPLYKFVNESPVSRWKIIGVNHREKSLRHLEKVIR